MKLLTVLREKKGWSRSELARQAHLHPSQVGVFESGRMIPYDSQLIKLATALGIDNPQDLMADVSDARAAQ